MTEAFWWYLLAGFILGFSVSTFWEWVYFRRRRMAIRDRRIAELESTVRTYMVATNVQETSTAVEEDWTGDSFESPHVYLETEETPVAASPPDTLPPSGGSPVSAYKFVGATANGAGAPAPSPYEGVQTARVAPVAYAAQQAGGSPTGGFQSVAVQQAPVTTAGANPSEKSRAPAALAAAAVAATALHESAGEQDADAPAAARSDEELPADEELPETPGADMSLAATLEPESNKKAEAGSEPKESRQESTTTGEELANAIAALAGIAAVKAVRDETADDDPAKADPAKADPAKADSAKADSIAQDAVTEDPVPIDAATSTKGLVAIAAANEDETAADAASPKPITSDDLETLRASINELLENVSSERVVSEAGAGRTSAGQAITEGDSEYSIAQINGRTEYVLVRLVQSVVQFARQVRTIFSGDRAERPALRAATSADDLTRVEGLTDAHVERLRVAGITSFGQLGALSTDELRMMLLTPGEAKPLDYEQLRIDAVRLAGAAEGARV